MILVQASRYHRFSVLEKSKPEEKTPKKENDTESVSAIKERLETQASGGINPGRRIIHQEMEKLFPEENMELDKKVKAF